MKKIFFAIASAIICVSASFAAPYALNMKDFTELKVVDGINVIHKCMPDSAGCVTFETSESIAPKILFSNNKNQLKIELSTDGETIKGLPTVHVYSSFLAKAENSGDSTITVITPAPASQLKLRVIGNGTIIAKDIHATQAEGKIDSGKGHVVMTGKVQNVKLSNTGTGRIEAGNLQAETGKCSILGTGPIDCSVSDELTIVGLGSGTVYVKGKPKIKNRTIGVKVVEVQ